MPRSYANEYKKEVVVDVEIPIGLGCSLGCRNAIHRNFGGVIPLIQRHYLGKKILQKSLNPKGPYSLLHWVQLPLPSQSNMAKPNHPERNEWKENHRKMWTLNFIHCYCNKTQSKQKCNKNERKFNNSFSLCCIQFSYSAILHRKIIQQGLPTLASQWSKSF